MTTYNLIYDEGPRYVSFMNINEYRRNVENTQRKNERPVECSFVFKYLAKFNPETILDVGTGISALPAMMSQCGYKVTAIDNIVDYWKAGCENRHYLVMDGDITNVKFKSKYDFITCISTLEHIKKYKEAFHNMISALKSTGKLIITCPYNEDEYIDNVYKLKDSIHNKKIKLYVSQAFSREKVDELLARENCYIIEQEYWQYYSGKFWSCGEPIFPPNKVDSTISHQMTCVLIGRHQ